MTEGPLTSARATLPKLRLARRFGAFAAALAMIGIATALGSFAIGSAILTCAAVVGWLGWIQGRDARAADLAQRADQELTRGRTEEAEALHAQIPARSKRRGLVARAVAYQRGLLALYRGDPPGAIAELGPALEMRTRLVSRTAEHAQRSLALSVRALAYAMQDAAAESEADAREVEAQLMSSPEAIARIELARAVLLGRQRRKSELASLLGRRGSLLLEHTMPRERVLVRALRTLARSETRSVYREAGKRDGDEGGGAAASWIGAIVPDAAVHAPSDATFAERAPALETPVALPAAARSIAAARRHAIVVKKPLLYKIRIVAALVVALAGASAAFLLVTDPGPRQMPSSSAAHGTGLVAVLVWLVAAVLPLKIAFDLRRSNRYNIAMLAARRALATGNETAARAAFGEFVASGALLFRGCGHALLAALEERQARFAECIAECDRGIAVVSSVAAVRAVATPQLLPSMLAARAVALAALGKVEEASAELALLASNHASYIHLAVADFRVRLLNAVRSGDLAAARAVARGRTADLPLPLTDDILCDLVLATEPGGLPRADKERVSGELGDDARLRAWIDAAAPDLRNALAHASQAGPRIAQENVPAEPKAEEEEAEDARAQGRALPYAL